jgi:hypothetical protein
LEQAVHLGITHSQAAHLHLIAYRLLVVAKVVWPVVMDMRVNQAALVAVAVAVATLAVLAMLVAQAIHLLFHHPKVVTVALHLETDQPMAPVGVVVLAL